MRGTLKKAMAAALGVLAACGPVPPKRAANEDVVPPESVPAGFEQKDCHFVGSTEDSPETTSTIPMGGTGDISTQASRGGQTHTRRIQCHRQVNLPTGSVLRPKSLCGAPDGLIRRCGDDS